MDEENNIEFDTEIALQFLLAYASDPDLKQDVVDRISKRTGLSSDKVEEVLHVMLQVLLKENRSN